MKRPIAALAALVLACLSSTFPAQAIVGASRDGSRHAGEVVMVLRSGARAGFCSGVVVGRRAVLTAGHCVAAAEALRVHYRDDAPVLLPVARVVRHPGFRADAVSARVKSVDLAIVVTRDPLPARFSPATIGAFPAQVGAAATIAGFGPGREGDAASAGVLREADVALRAPVSQLLLWLDGAGGACSGDSGGPVFAADGALVGVVAFAEGAHGARCGALTQAVRAAPFAEWIRKASSE